MKSSATAAIPLVRGHNVQASSRRRFFDYPRLFSIAIRHEFYGRGPINSDLFRVSLTLRTAARVAALGMVPGDGSSPGGLLFPPIRNSPA